MRPVAPSNSNFYPISSDANKSTQEGLAMLANITNSTIEPKEINKQKNISLELTHTDLKHIKECCAVADKSTIVVNTKAIDKVVDLEKIMPGNIVTTPTKEPTGSKQFSALKSLTSSIPLNPTGS